MRRIDLTSGGQGVKAGETEPSSTSLLVRLGQRTNRDEGTTLIELLVGMVLMSIFLAMFTGAVLMMNGAMNKAQAVNLTSSQLNVAFQSLDKTVRYAAAVSPPGKGAKGDWYVELRTTNTGSEACTQLRVDSATQQLQRRTWAVRSTVASQLSAWVPIASGISNGSADSGSSTQPFVVPVRPNAKFQQLMVTLISPAGSGGSLTTSTSSYTFTAVNSVTPAPAAPICQQQGRP